MTEPYLGEIAIFSFNFTPQGWAQCNGQLLQINQNEALYVILGTRYGGDGLTTFGLPNLQGRVPVHVGSSYTLGQAGGEAEHGLTALEMPSHTHVPIASGAAADRPTPNGNAWAANGTYPAFSSQADESMSPEGVAQAGANQPHPNMSPYLPLNFCIALVGIFPSRD